MQLASRVAAGAKRRTRRAPVAKASKSLICHQSEWSASTWRHGARAWHFNSPTLVDEIYWKARCKGMVLILFAPVDIGAGERVGLWCVSVRARATKAATFVAQIYSNSSWRQTRVSSVQMEVERVARRSNIESKFQSSRCSFGDKKTGANLRASKVRQ